MTEIRNFQIENLDCANCAAKLERGIKQLPGVNFVSINFAAGKMHLDAEDIDAVKHHIHQVEPGVNIVQSGETRKTNNRFLSPEFIKIFISTILLIIGLVFQSRMTIYSRYLIFGIAYLLSGFEVIVAAVKNISHKEWFDETFLMSIATLGAIGIGDLPEAVTVMVFYQIGEIAQSWTVENTRRSINSLLAIRPNHANAVRDGNIIPCQPEDVEVGETIIVRPGERVPLDGLVIEGHSFLDTSALTGEFRPKEVSEEDIILAGMVNRSGMLTVSVTKPFAQSSVNKMLELVQNAAERKSRTQRFITRFAKVYTPIVVVLAILVATIPPLVIPGEVFKDWIYRALILLVISCPCALVLSIPIGFFGGIGAASKNGILVKGANFLDVLAGIDTVVFDKTGTLTRGVFKVIEIHPEPGWTEESLLKIAAQAGALSNHPISKSILQAYHDFHNIEQPAEFEEIPGLGLKAKVNGTRVLVGNDDFMHKEGIPHPACQLSGMAAHVAVDGAYAGYLYISDEVKASSTKTIEQLRKNGVKKIIILTGDQEDEASRVAHLLQVDNYYAGLKPEEKLGIVEKLKQAEGSGKLAFVGDGINDTPALARADVGIAMGGMGSDAAIDTADVVVMTDEPIKVSQVIHIAQETKRIVWQNITMAFIVKGLFILLGIWGIAGMWHAVFADVGVTLLAVINASRIIRLRI